MGGPFSSSHTSRGISPSFFSDAKGYCTIFHPLVFSPYWELESLLQLRAGHRNTDAKSWELWKSLRLEMEKVGVWLVGGAQGRETISHLPGVHMEQRPILSPLIVNF